MLGQPKDESKQELPNRSVVLKALGLTFDVLLQAMDTDGVAVYEGGRRLGYIFVDQLAPEHQNMTGPNGRLGSNGLLIIRGGVIHSFVPLAQIPPLKL